MDRLIFNSARALSEQSLQRQSLVHELANVSTIGFKRSWEMSISSIKAEGEGFDTRFQPQTYALDQIQLTPGPVMVTGNNLDVAMAKSTVLGVQAEDGTATFTRRGDLRLNVNGVLENGSGHIVRGTNGPITIPPGFNVYITSEGGVYAQDPLQTGVQQGQLIDTLLLRDASATSLARREDGLFKVEGRPDGTDIENGAEPPSVIPKALEGSNVSAIQMMVKLMDHTRTFEAQIRVIKESKDLDENGATMMRQG